MIVQVAPIKRLPKQLTVLDYAVPIELQKDIAVGQLVTIPFKHSHIQGIVFSIHKKAKEHHATKDIITIIHPTPLLHKQHITLYSKLAECYGLAIGSILKFALLPMQKRKLTSMQLLPYSCESLSKKNTSISFVTTPNLRSYAAMLKTLISQTNGQTLILVPESYRIDECVAALPKSLQTKTIVWHSGLTTKEQFDHWLKIRNGEAQIIIGNRSAVFLPGFTIEHIIIAFEADEQHKHWDQNPRFHVKDIAAIRQQVEGINISYSGPIPSLEAYTLLDAPLPILPREKLPNIIDMRGERAQHNYSVLSHSIQDALLQAKDDVFIFLNRRGFATSLSCQDCGSTHRCPSCSLPFVYHEKDNSLRCHYCHTRGKISLVCGKCGSSMVRLRGAGTELVEKQVKELFKDKHSHDIIRIDADTDITQLPKDFAEKPRLIIGTQKAMQFIRWNQTELAILSSIDQQLALPEYLATEHIWQFIHNIIYRLPAKSRFVIQSMNPDHPLFQSIGEPELFYRSLGASYKALYYPPYSYMVRYMIALPKKQAAQTVARQAHKILGDTLTKTKKRITLSSPYEMHPHVYRGKYWYAILVKIPPRHWEKDLIEINKCFGPEWRVDPHPISLLSP